MLWATQHNLVTPGIIVLDSGVVQRGPGRSNYSSIFVQRRWMNVDTVEPVYPPFPKRDRNTLAIRSTFDTSDTPPAWYCNIKRIRKSDQDITTE